MSDSHESNASHGPAAEARGGSVPRAPAYGSLPDARMRLGRGSPEVREITVRVEVVTPTLGGSTRTREVDEVDIIRAATVRGHLRFWWRALYAAQYPNASTLYVRESEIWGRAATDEGGRSAVEIRIDDIDVERTGEIDKSDIDLQRTPGAYALWPARAEKRQGQVMKSPAPRRVPGTQFRLTLIAASSCEREVREVRNALRAWILFGGYGGRTRRGLGSLKVLDHPNSWLPSKATCDAIKNLFGFDVLASPTNAPGDSPWLGGAALQVGKAEHDAMKAPGDSPWLGGSALQVGRAERDGMKAWTTALDWLKEFRQGTSGQQGSRAREPGTGKPQPQRPSISNWPEADKIRHIKRKTNAHPPRHNANAVWPRAGFGLPIIGQFQRNARNGGRYDEPDGFELRWRSGNTDHDRLASPLIVKALPLADGTFVPCALWLNRAYPAGDVVLRGANNSSAPFDRLVAADDTAQFSALANKQSLRAAFLDWLHAKYQTTVVAP